MKYGIYRSQRGDGDYVGKLVAYVNAGGRRLALRGFAIGEGMVEDLSLHASLQHVSRVPVLLAGNATYVAMTDVEADALYERVHG